MRRKMDLDRDSRLSGNSVGFFRHRSRPTFRSIGVRLTHRSAYATKLRSPQTGSRRAGTFAVTGFARDEFDNIFAATLATPQIVCGLATRLRSPLSPFSFPSISSPGNAADSALPPFSLRALRLSPARGGWLMCSFRLSTSSAPPREPRIVPGRRGGKSFESPARIQVPSRSKRAPGRARSRRSPDDSNLVDFPRRESDGRLCFTLANVHDHLPPACADEELITRTPTPISIGGRSPRTGHLVGLVNGSPAPSIGKPPQRGPNPIRPHRPK